MMWQKFERCGLHDILINEHGDKALLVKATPGGRKYDSAALNRDSFGVFQESPIARGRRKFVYIINSYGQQGVISPEDVPNVWPKMGPHGVYQTLHPFEKPDHPDMHDDRFGDNPATAPRVPLQYAPGPRPLLDHVLDATQRDMGIGRVSDLLKDGECIIVTQHGMATARRGQVVLL